MQTTKNKLYHHFGDVGHRFFSNFFPHWCSVTFITTYFVFRLLAVVAAFDNAVSSCSGDLWGGRLYWCSSGALLGITSPIGIFSLFSSQACLLRWDLFNGSSLFFVGVYTFQVFSTPVVQYGTKHKHERIISIVIDECARDIILCL